MKLATAITPERLYNRMNQIVKSIYHTTDKRFEETRLQVIEAFKKMTYSERVNELEGCKMEDVATYRVNKKFSESERVPSVNKLLGIYLKEKDFYTHEALGIAAKLYFLMKNISTKSESYKQFLQEKEVDVKHTGFSIFYVPAINKVTSAEEEI